MYISHPFNHTKPNQPSTHITPTYLPPTSPSNTEYLIHQPIQKTIIHRALIHLVTLKLIYTPPTHLSIHTITDLSISTPPIHPPNHLFTFPTYISIHSNITYNAESPVLHEKSPGYMTLKVGSNFMMFCEVRAKPESSVRWLKDNRDLTIGGQYWLWLLLFSIMVVVFFFVVFDFFYFFRGFRSFIFL